MYRQSGSERLSDLRIQVPVASTRTNRGTVVQGLCLHRHISGTQLRLSSTALRKSALGALRKHPERERERERDFNTYPPDRQAPDCLNLSFLLASTPPPLPCTHFPIDISVGSQLHTVILAPTFHSLLLVFPPDAAINLWTRVLAEHCF